LLQSIKRAGISERKRAHTATLEMHYVRPTSQGESNIFTQGTDIGPFGAGDTERELGATLFQEFEMPYRDGASLTCNSLALSGKAIEALATIFHSGIHGRDLLQYTLKMA